LHSAKKEKLYYDYCISRQTSKRTRVQQRLEGTNIKTTTTTTNKSEVGTNHIGVLFFTTMYMGLIYVIIFLYKRFNDQTSATNARY
jgi:hypothetical protein